MIANSHDVAREQSKSQGFSLEVGKTVPRFPVQTEGCDNMCSLGLIDHGQSSPILALCGRQNSKDVPFTPPPKISILWLFKQTLIYVLL